MVVGHGIPLFHCNSKLNLEKLGPLGKGVRLAGHVWGMGRKQSFSPRNIYFSQASYIEKKYILMSANFYSLDFVFFPFISRLVF